MYLIPRPQELKRPVDGLHAREGVPYVIAYDSEIISDPRWDSRGDQYAGLLKQRLKNRVGYDIFYTRGAKRKNSIYLGRKEGLSSEEYEFSSSEDGIAILAGDYPGLLHGVMTLCQIVEQKGAVIPSLFIKDYPEIPNRGFYHDATRGRIPTLDYLKSLADKMAFYKMNQLQLYIEHSFLFRKFSEVWRDDTPITAQEIIELDAYCQRLNIELVPSLSCFGHLYKVLRTKSYSGLCEMEESEKEPFTFLDRMHHHTLDISNPDSMDFVKDMITEFIPLFSSNKFNICGDETFDLGKGKSKALADKIGIKEMYTGFVKELCRFLVDMGKTPMFWGDIICGFPEAVKELPPETICLNWGYAPEQREDESRKLYEAGAIQYSCPGVGGWNQWINLIESSYRNIKRMCGYAKKYQCIGVLNTDWGDFGHINHPAFSTAGMIYGAAFSWNSDVPVFEEMNRQISRLEFGDSTEAFVALAAEAADYSVFQWEPAVRFMELHIKKAGDKEIEDYFKETDMKGFQEANKGLEALKEKFYHIIACMEPEKRPLVKPYLLALDGIRLFNSAGAVIAEKKYALLKETGLEPWNLAAALENWLYQYKEVWRSVSKESELCRIQDVIVWYGDYLREW